MLHSPAVSKHMWRCLPYNSSWECGVTLLLLLCMLSSSRIVAVVIYLRYLTSQVCRRQVYVHSHNMPAYLAAILYVISSADSIPPPTWSTYSIVYEQQNPAPDLSTGIFRTIRRRIWLAQPLAAVTPGCKNSRFI